MKHGTVTGWVRSRAWMHATVAVVLLLPHWGCATVPKNRRGYLSHPSMPAQDDSNRKRSMRKFHNTREAAAGGDGKPAGGGCGCAN